MEKWTVAYKPQYLLVSFTCKVHNVFFFSAFSERDEGQVPEQCMLNV